MAILRRSNTQNDIIIYTMTRGLPIAVPVALQVADLECLQSLASALHHQEESLKFTGESWVHDFQSYGVGLFISK
ncbi:hypothetical protein BKA56DRAFT_580974 [Ilyonectria sp. MPI-CAGE-AT-0026]|nr:hypothetical protein BKA56DRAFT_580974 [Ilyonectria sp. MPI-CAGE-AT-0026]